MSIKVIEWAWKQALSAQNTAVHSQRLASDEGGTLRWGQEGNRLGDLLHFSGTSQRVGALGPVILLRSRLVRNARISVEIGDNETGPKTDDECQVFL